MWLEFDAAQFVMGIKSKVLFRYFNKFAIFNLHFRFEGLRKSKAYTHAKSIQTG